MSPQEKKPFMTTSNQKNINNTQKNDLNVPKPLSTFLGSTQRTQRTQNVLGARKNVTSSACVGPKSDKPKTAEADRTTETENNNSNENRTTGLESSTGNTHNNETGYPVENNFRAKPIPDRHIACHILAYRHGMRKIIMTHFLHGESWLNDEVHMNEIKNQIKKPKYFHKYNEIKKSLRKAKHDDTNEDVFNQHDEDFLNCNLNILR